MQQLITCSRNDVDKVRQIVHILCIVAFQDVTPRELDVLCEIVLFGYGSDARDSFIINHNSTRGNYTQIIQRLADKGILLPKPYKRTKVLHPDFLRLKELYIDSGNEFLIVQVNGSI